MTLIHKEHSSHGGLKLVFFFHKTKSHQESMLNQHCIKIFGQRQVELQGTGDGGRQLSSSLTNPSPSPK